ncbi:hypothetical protein [Methanogenium cariaci]|uniref:hypothetical protein n=1 Tax=Methanogenium cariaci TaxID=2197 RepID=UPI00155D8F6C|nr:hypothetical protein [Methanogenium cariaci]
MTEVVNSVTTTMTEFRAEIIPLIESKVDKDGTIPILIINPPGWGGSSGYYSPPEVLKEAAQNGGVYHAGLHMYWIIRPAAKNATGPNGLSGTLQQSSQKTPAGRTTGQKDLASIPEDVSLRHTAPQSQRWVLTSGSPTMSGGSRKRERSMDDMERSSPQSKRPGALTS